MTLPDGWQPLETAPIADVVLVVDAYMYIRKGYYANGFWNDEKTSKPIYQAVAWQPLPKTDNLRKRVEWVENYTPYPSTQTLRHVLRVDP